MKKAVLKILVVIMAVCAMLCAFTACEDNNAADAPIHKHSFVDFTVNPTCTVAGYTLHKCACGEDYKDNFTDALSHNYINGKCSLCGAADPNYVEPVEECTHDYEWTTVKEPTETQEGVKSGVCKKCGDTITQTIPTLSHEHNYIITVKAPTCTTNGYTLHKCLCGEEYKTDEKAALGHTSAEAIEENRIKATCTEDGSYDSVIYCSICHTEILRENKIIPATGHEFINYVSDGNATYESDGTKTAYCNNGCGAKDTIPDIGSKLVHTGIKFNSLTTNGTNVNGKVPNEQTTFSFLTEISVSGNATFSVSYDINGNNKIPNKTVNLSVGDNVFYVLEEVNGNASNLFTVTVRRRPVYTVSFNTVGGSAVQPQYVEEDSLATEPITTRAGYTFTGWNYDFTTPITKNTTVTASWVYYTLTTGANNDKAGTVTVHNETKITVGESVTITAATNDGYTFNGWFGGDNLLTNELSYTFTMPNENLFYMAKWTANANTKYLVEHYLEELDGSFTKQESDTLEKYGTTDTLATVQTTDIKEYEGFTHATVSQSVESANLNGDESTVLKVYYTRNEYTIRLVAGDNVKVVNSINGKYKYGYTIEDVTANYNEGYLGYDWKGWHNGNDVLTYETTIPSFTVDKDMDFTADFTVKPEMANYNFTSNTTECTITRIKDKKVTEVIIPNYVTNIGSSAFKGCSGLTSTTIPDSVTSIGNSAFSGCSSLTSITIGNSVTSIGDGAFAGCSSLTSITIGNSVKSIGDSAFSRCSGLTSITIGGSVKSIGYAAFYNCSSLTSITIPDSVTSIGHEAFVGCTSLQYYEYDSAYYLGNTINNYTVLIKAKESSISSCGINKKTKLIYDSAFYECKSLTSIIIPDSVTGIGDYAFYRCNGLTELTIGNSVTNIGTLAFFDCIRLTSITIPNCVTSIGYEAFNNCHNVTSIIISNSVTWIGNAFRSCWNLTSVFYEGTAANWNHIPIDSNTDLTRATRYYYSATEPVDEGNYWHYAPDGITPVIWVKEN